MVGRGNQTMAICDALTWGNVGCEKDYVPCSEIEGISRVRLVGLMLAVEANLCEAHQKYFMSSPAGWGSLLRFDAATNQQVYFDGRKRFLGCIQKWKFGTTLLAK